MAKQLQVFPRGAGRIAALMLLAAALVAPASAAPVAHVQVAGIDRSYTVHVPDAAPPAGGFPLVLAFHGGGMDGQAMARLTRFDAVADQRRFIVVYPDGVDKHWNDGRSTIKNPQDDVGFVAAMIDQLRQRYPIDAGRIHATGISNGALFAERLGCELSAQIGAIAPVAGTMPADLRGNCHPARPVAVLQIGGTQDPIMPYGGGKVADFGGRGEGGEVLSFADTGSFWARANGCHRLGPARALPVVAPLDRTRAGSAAYTGCPASGAVQLVTVQDGGHTWPGGPQYARRIVVGLVSRQIDASSMIADFFLAQPPASRRN
jgi:polyhydroxybutyrate depolymerase